MKALWNEVRPAGADRAFPARGEVVEERRGCRPCFYGHQPGMDRGVHSVVHFQFRFVSLTFVAFFIASAVIVSKAWPRRLVIRTAAWICSHLAPKSQVEGETRRPPRVFHWPG